MSAEKQDSVVAFGRILVLSGSRSPKIRTRQRKTSEGKQATATLEIGLTENRQKSTKAGCGLRPLSSLFLGLLTKMALRDVRFGLSWMIVDGEGLLRIETTFSSAISVLLSKDELFPTTKDGTENNVTPWPAYHRVAHCHDQIQKTETPSSVEMAHLDIQICDVRASVRRGRRPKGIACVNFQSAGHESVCECNAMRICSWYRFGLY